jgi:hypothetical protein
VCLPSSISSRWIQVESSWTSFPVKSSLFPSATVLLCRRRHWGALWIDTGANHSFVAYGGVRNPTSSIPKHSDLNHRQTIPRGRSSATSTTNRLAHEERVCSWLKGGTPRVRAVALSPAWRQALKARISHSWLFWLFGLLRNQQTTEASLWRHAAEPQRSTVLGRSIRPACAETRL